MCSLAVSCNAKFVSATCQIRLCTVDCYSNSLHLQNNQCQMMGWEAWASVNSRHSSKACSTQRINSFMTMLTSWVVASQHVVCRHKVCGDGFYGAQVKVWNPKAIDTTSIILVLVCVFHAVLGIQYMLPKVAQACMCQWWIYWYTRKLWVWVYCSAKRLPACVGCENASWLRGTT